MSLILTVAMTLYYRQANVWKEELERRFPDRTDEEREKGDGAVWFRYTV
jgi:hypothetical protein